MSSIEERFKLIEDCYDDVARYLKKFDLGEDYSDAVQDTFVEAYAKARTLRDESKVKNWVIKIARSKGLKLKRKKGLMVALEFVFKEELPPMEFANTYEEDALTTIVNKNDDELLIEAIGSLKDKERKALVHQYFYEEKVQEIAEDIGESLNNTKSILRRARAKVKKYLIKGGY